MLEKQESGQKNGLSTALFERPFQSIRPDHQEIASVFGRREFLFLAAHIPLALAMHVASIVSTVHAWATISIAIMIALRTPRPERLLYLAGYITGCEVLWRMTEAHAFMQTGKYLIVVIFLIGLIRFRSSKSSLLPAIFFSLLVPSMIVTVMLSDGYFEVKKALSYNLSGPLAFAVAAWFFSRLWISEKDIQRIFLFVIAPVAGICTLTIYSTVTAPEIIFAPHSNWITSGGYSPTHVSAILGLAGLFCYLLFLLNRSRGIILRTVLLAGVFIFTIETALTFARGGLYEEIGGSIVASYYFFRTKRLRSRVLFFLTAVVVLSAVIVLPQLTTFTRGAITRRLTDTDTTRRDTLALEDLTAFIQNPLFGVGAGRSQFYRSLEALPSHTEYTRLLAEHGVFGLVALILFVSMFYQRWRQMGAARLFLAPLIAWGLLYQSIECTRIVAPVLLPALAFVTILTTKRVRDVTEYSNAVQLQMT